MLDNGSVQKLAELTDHEKAVFKTFKELSQLEIIQQASIRQKYVDQSISANHYYNFAKYDSGNLPISDVARDLLYAYKMGVKTLYYANTDDGKTDDIESCQGGACSI